MNSQLTRRTFIKVAGIAGISAIVFNVESSAAADSPQESFSFVQLSDTHWGFDNPAINPDFAGTLKKAIAEVNALAQQPDFIVFTGDLTHTTDDETIRRKRMKEFREIIKELKVQNHLLFSRRARCRPRQRQGLQRIFPGNSLCFRPQGRSFYRHR